MSPPLTTDLTVPRAQPGATHSQDALSEFGAIDIIVNNAGYTWDNVIQKTTGRAIPVHARYPRHYPLSHPARRLSLDPRGKAKKEIEAGTPVMRKVVNVTSISGLDGNPGQAGYSAGKSAVVGPHQNHG